MKSRTMKKIAFKGETVEDWLGARLHKFPLEKHTAWVVEPAVPLPGRPWFWVPEWPTAFPERNGAKALLDLGFYMIHVNVLGMFANPAALKIMRKLYDLVRSYGFPEKGALIGMSLGGLYSFRYAETYPETVSCIYADAPVCDLNFSVSGDSVFSKQIRKAWDKSNLAKHPLSPVNNLSRMAKAHIPILMLLGDYDLSVDPKTNGDLLAARYAEKGGKIEVEHRPYWGHHPHGLDNPLKIVRFILANTLEVRN